MVPWGAQAPKLVGSEAEKTRKDAPYRNRLRLVLLVETGKESQR
ncbi:MAG: hypothetical protein AB4426_07110 [Xenococcaceae cyanobacterium]